MSRLIHRQITVSTDEYNRPTSFTDNGFTHHITHIIDWWIESGAWVYGEPSRTVYRVLTDNQGMYDIECVGGEWFIYRVWD